MFSAPKSLIFRAFCVSSLAICAGVAHAQASEQPAPCVVVAPAAKMNGAAVRMFPGVIEAVKTVDCVARVQGFQQKTLFTEGSMVKAGDLLFELEDTTYQATVDSLKAKKEQLVQSLDLAKREFERSKKLIERGIVTEANHDIVACTYLKAQAAIKEIDASIIDAENNLSYTKIHAPISGRIGKASYTDGNLVALSSGKLVTIEQIAPIYATFSLSERVFRQDFGGLEGIKKNAVVQLKLADGTVYSEKAQVTLVDNKIDSGTNTIRLWVTFKNEDQALMPGSYVTIMLSKASETQPVTVLPSALILEEGGYAVWIVNADNTVTHRKVVPGQLVGDRQIILQGLHGDETVVVDGNNKIIPGKPIAPVPYKKAAKN